MSPWNNFPLASHLIKFPPSSRRQHYRNLHVIKVSCVLPIKLCASELTIDKCQSARAQTHFNLQMPANDSHSWKSFSSLDASVIPAMFVYAFSFTSTTNSPKCKWNNKSENIDNMKLRKEKSKLRSMVGKEIKKLLFGGGGGGGRRTLASFGVCGWEGESYVIVAKPFAHLVLLLWPKWVLCLCAAPSFH